MDSLWIWRTKITIKIQVSLKLICVLVRKIPHIVLKNIHAKCKNTIRNERKKISMCWYFPNALCFLSKFVFDTINISKNTSDIRIADNLNIESGLTRKAHCKIALQLCANCYQNLFRCCIRSPLDFCLLGYRNSTLADLK